MPNNSAKVIVNSRRLKVYTFDAQFPQKGRCQQCNLQSLNLSVDARDCIRLISSIAKSFERFFTYLLKCQSFSLLASVAAPNGWFWAKGETVSLLGSGSVSRVLEPSTSFSGVHRISIVERHTCMPLHDKVWVWKEDETSPSTSAKIIALFHQFARTVGMAGENETVVSVTFDTQVEQEKKFKKRLNYNNANRFTAGRLTSGSSSAPASVATLRQRSLASIENVPMEMVCASNEKIIIAIFFAPNTYKNDPRQVAKDILNDFMTQYHETLATLEPIFTSSLRDAEKARNDLSLLPHFEKFELPIFAASLPQTGPTKSVVSSKVEGGGSVILTSDEPYLPSSISHHGLMPVYSNGYMPSHLTQSHGNGVIQGASDSPNHSGNFMSHHMPHHQHTSSLGSHAGFAIGSGKSNNNAHPGAGLHSRSLSSTSHSSDFNA